MVFYTILQLFPKNAQVAVGTTALLTLGAVPVIMKSRETKRGHDYFSAEKPDAVETQQQAREDAKYARR